MVSKADFFVGNTTRSECEARVKAANHGDFVVRQDSDGQYSLIVNDDSNAVQFKIRHANNQFSFGKTSFRTMDALIDNLRRKAIGSSSGKPIILKSAAFTVGRSTVPGARATPGRPSAEDRRRLLEQQVKGPGMSPTPAGRNVTSPQAHGGDAPATGVLDTVKIVNLRRTPPYGLGIKITEHAEPGCVGCVIKAINNPALAQAGVLRVGQKIHSVDGTRVDTMTVPQLTEMLKGVSTAQVGVVATDYMPPRITDTMKKKVNLFIAPIDIQAFNELDVRATKRTDIDTTYRGKKFNRYLDILPNPSTAVQLSEIPMDPASTYINANFVRGHGVTQAPPSQAGGQVPRNTYIAAQGPLPSTVDAFIRMIWENQARFIVQTTNFIENKKRKCERYFPTVIGPSGARDFNGISVTLTGTELRKGYKYSQLTFAKGPSRRSVEHFWFISWPDHGVPTDRLGRMYPNHVTDMLLHVRDRRKAVDDYASPLVVHCSAGVGRTGTFIVIDHVIAAIANKDRVDIIDIIKQCREDRMAIVQHTVQYKFAYQACINHAEIVMAATNGDIFAMESPTRKSVIKIDKDSIYEATTSADGTSLFRLRRGATSMKKAKEDKAVFEETPAAPEDEAVPTQEGVGAGGLSQLEDEPWYFGALSRDAMSAILKESPVGSFGVRVSSQPGCFVLTFQQDNKHTPQAKRLQSILIQPCKTPTGSDAFKLDQCSDRLFSSIVELVNYFITNAVSYVDDRTGITHRLFLDNTLEE